MGSRVAATGVSKARNLSFLYHIISSLQTRRTTRHEQVARLFQDRGAGLSPCARNTIREAISRDTSSSQHAGHAVRRNRTRNAAGTFSGHCQRSRRICEQKCGWPSLSDDERRVQRRAVTGSSTSSWFTSCMISNIFNLFNLLFLNLFQPSQPFPQHLVRFSTFQHLCHSTFLLRIY